MALASLTVDLSVLLANLRAPREAIVKGVKAGVRDAAAWGLREAKEQAPISTGNLRRNIHAKVTTPTATSVAMKLGVGVPGTRGKPLVYARIQDVGGVVKPKTARKLAIPVFKRFKTKKARVGGIRARDVLAGIDAGDPDWSFGFESYSFTSRAILGWRKRGAKGKMRSEVLFARASSVYIQGTRYLTTVRRDLEGGRLADFIEAHIRRELQAVP